MNSVKSSILVFIAFLLIMDNVFAAVSFNIEELKAIKGPVAKLHYMEDRISSLSEDPEANYQYAYLLERFRRYEEALERYKEAIILAPNVAKYYFGAADVLMILNDNEGAENYYGKGLKFDPNNKWALSRLEKIMAAKNDTAVQVIHVNNDMISIHIKDFWIDVTEVSVEEYKKFNTGYLAPEGFTEQMPVVNISFNDAVEYAKYMNKRLCTEDEWKTALALQGSSDTSEANIHQDVYGFPYPVNEGLSERKTNIVNMLGNVSEWVVRIDGSPALIGGHWYSEIMLEGSINSLLLPRSVNNPDTKVAYAGIRLCHD